MRVDPFGSEMVVVITDILLNCLIHSRHHEARSKRLEASNKCSETGDGHVWWFSERANGQQGVEASRSEMSQVELMWKQWRIWCEDNRMSWHSDGGCCRCWLSTFNEQKNATFFFTMLILSTHFFSTQCGGDVVFFTLFWILFVGGNTWMTAKSKIKITPTHITYCTMFRISISSDAVALGECGETLFYCGKLFCTL